MILSQRSSCEGSNIYYCIIMLLESWAVCSREISCRHCPQLLCVSRFSVRAILDWAMLTLVCMHTHNLVPESMSVLLQSVNPFWLDGLLVVCWHAPFRATQICQNAVLMACLFTELCGCFHSCFVVLMSCVGTTCEVHHLSPHSLRF